MEQNQEILADASTHLPKPRTSHGVVGPAAQALEDEDADDDVHVVGTGQQPLGSKAVLAALRAAVEVRTPLKRPRDEAEEALEMDENLGRMAEIFGNSYDLPTLQRYLRRYNGDVQVLPPFPGRPPWAPAPEGVLVSRKLPEGKGLVRSCTGAVRKGSTAQR